MKIKFFCLLGLLLFLTGCSVEYHLDLDQNLNLTETINVYSNSEGDISEFRKFNLYIPIDKEVDEYSSFENKSKDLDYYNMNKSDEKIKFYNVFDKGTYVDSMIVNTAYEYISITEVEEKKIVLSSSMDFLLFDIYENLDSVKIKITSKYKLLKTNADEVNYHEYIWNINRENAKDKNIYLTFDTTVDDRSFLEKLQEGEYTNIFTVSIVLSVIAGIVYLFLKRKSDMRDKI